MSWKKNIVHFLEQRLIQDLALVVTWYVPHKETSAWGPFYTETSTTIFGKRHEWVCYKPTNVSDSSEYIMYDNGVKHGRQYVVNAQNIVIWSRSWVQGREHGKSETYTNTGTKMREYTYVHGQLHGPCLQWHDNGKLKLKCTHHHGKLHGYYRRYLHDGTLRYIRTFRNGHEISPPENLPSI